MKKRHALIYLPHISTFSKRQLSGGSDVMEVTRDLISCYQSFALVSAHGLISLWYFRCLRMGKIDVITYKYVIIIFNISNLFLVFNRMWPC